jgi:hypothetical protein
MHQNELRSALNHAVSIVENILPIRSLIDTFYIIIVFSLFKSFTIFEIIEYIIHARLAPVEQLIASALDSILIHSCCQNH